MPNIIDYLEWRGDLGFQQSPFCEADNMVLSYLSYVNLDGLAPGEGERGITVKELSGLFFNRYTPEDLAKDKSFISKAPLILKAMACTVRFSNAVIRNYINIIDPEKDLQFAALEAQLGDGTSYVAFRGTDDTIVGWKEDFNLSNGTVPAQLESVKYLNKIGRTVPGGIRVGGHSKGGNLAVYAAAVCQQDIRAKITDIFNNDGPGFTEEFLHRREVQDCLPRITRILPECSVIGMLLDHAAEPIYIKSSQKGVMQHDGISWEVMGPKFVRADQPDPKACVLNEALDAWIHNMDAHKRNAVINDFFSVLDAPGVSTLTELQQGGLKHITKMFDKIETLSPDTKESVEELVRSLIGHWTKLL